MSTWQVRGLIIAFAFALGFMGVAATEEYSTAGEVTVNATSDWLTNAAVTVQPQTATSGDVAVTVTQGTNTMGALTLAAQNQNSSEFNFNVTINFHGSTAAVTVNFSDATLSGDEDNTASLNLASQGSDTEVAVTGATTLNGGASLSLTSGTGTVSFQTGSLVLQGAAGANTVTIGADTTLEAGTLLMSDTEQNSIDVLGNLNLTSTTDASTVSSGVLTVNAGGTVAFNTLTVDSSFSEIALEGGKLVFDGTLSLANGAALHVTAPGAGITDIAVIEGSGTVNVGLGSLLQVDADLSASTTSFFSEGTTNVEGLVTFKAKDFGVSNGTTTVATDATMHIAEAFTVSGGVLAINGKVEGTSSGFTFSQTAGATTIGADGLLEGFSSASISGGAFTVNGYAQADSFAVSGSANVSVGAYGTIKASELSMSGGSVTIAKDAYLDLTAAGTSTAPEGSLSIAGGSLVVSGWVDTGTMSLGSGGVVEVNAYDSDSNGGLNVAQAVGNAQGALKLYGGLAQFQGGASFANGGSVTSFASGSRVVGDLTMNSGTTLDTEAASLAITGNLVLAGTYRVGFSGSQNTIVSVSDEARVEETTDIRLSAALLQSIADNGDKRILAAGSTSGTITPHYQQGAWIFGVDVQSDGLYVEGLRPVSLSELLVYMYEEWNTHPTVKGNADKLMKRDFASVVLRASLDYVDSSIYQQLSLDGRQNALSLFAIGEGPSAASYSGLMLYNGAGLSAVNQANIDAARQSIAGLDRRIGSLRHEIAANTQDVCLPGRDQGYETYANRFWVDFSLARTRESWDSGFAGYDYDPRNLVIGYDRLFDRFAVGAAFNYGFGDFKDRAAERSDATINSYTFSAYGLYAAESGWFGSGSVGYTYYDNSIKDYRTLGHAGSSSGWNKADYNATGWQFAGTLGYELEVLDYFNLTPSVGLRYVRAKSESHSQKFSPTGGQAYRTLLAGEVKGHSTTLPVELAASYDIFGEEDSVLSLSAMVGYAYEMNGDGATGSVRYAGLNYPSVKIVSHSPGRNIFNTGVGLNYINERYQFGVDYRYAKRSEYSSHDLNGSFSLMF